MTRTARAHRSRATRTRTALTVIAGALALGACSTISSPSAPAEDGTTLTVVTHDSFALSESLLEDFEASTGYTIEQVAPGDGGALVNQLILTKDDPLGDVVYGIDNSFAGRALAEDVLEPYESPAVPEGGNLFDGALTPVDRGDVCVNVDHAWFAERGIPEPVTLEDLTAPEYADLLVVTNPATSSPGLSFLLATIGAFGEDGWQEYWRALADNGVKVVPSWTDAYYVDFSGSEGAGPRPLVVSYSSSPAAEVPEGADEPRTGALLETCFRQTEYAGVLAGADNVEGAQAFIDFLLSPEVQADIPGQMYMYPVREDVELPEAWERFAPLAAAPHEVAPEDIAAHRDEWISAWTEIVLG